MEHPPALELELLRSEHADGMFEGLADAAGYRFLPDDPPAGVEALRSLYERQIVGRSADGSQIWLNWVARRLESKRLVGFTQATISDHTALIGYHVFPAVWGQGIGTSAVRLTIDRLFRMAVIHDVRALVDTRNARSIALLRRLRFRLAGTVLDADHFKGSRSSEHEFVMLRRDWVG